MEAYYLLFEEYSEYNQFEGTWQKGYLIYPTEDSARRMMQRMQNMPNDYRDILLGKSLPL